GRSVRSAAGGPVGLPQTAPEIPCPISMPAPLITAPADPPAKVSESVLEPPRAEPASAKLMEPAVSQTARLSGAVPDAELEASSEFPIVSISKTRPAVVERVQTGLGSPPPGSPETAAPPLGAKPAG